MLPNKRKKLNKLGREPTIIQKDNTEDRNIALYQGTEADADIQKMCRFLSGVLVSEMLALWVEFFYKFGAKLNVSGFVIAIPFYFVLLCILHAIFSKLKGIRYHSLICFAIGGMTGLAIEWFVVGNSPWQNPNALQSGQFLFHAVYPILGYLIVRRFHGKKLREYLLIYLFVASVVTAIGFGMLNPMRMLWFIFLPLIAYCGLMYFVYRFATFTPHSSTR